MSAPISAAEIRRVPAIRMIPPVEFSLAAVDRPAVTTTTTSVVHVARCSAPSAGSSVARVSSRSADAHAAASVLSGRTLGAWRAAARMGPIAARSLRSGTATTTLAPSAPAGCIPGSLTPSRRAAGAPSARSASTTRLPSRAYHVARRTSASATTSASSTATTASAAFSPPSRTLLRRYATSCATFPPRAATGPWRPGSQPALRTFPTAKSTGAPSALAMSRRRLSRSESTASTSTTPTPRVNPATSPATPSISAMCRLDGGTGTAGSSTAVPLVIDCVSTG